MLRILSSGNRIRRMFSGISETVVDRCTRKIRASLNPSLIKVTSSNDDPNGSHIMVVCVSALFEGKNTVQRQRLVYKAIWEELERDVHAVDKIVAFTPKEADGKSFG